MRIKKNLYLFLSILLLQGGCTLLQFKRLTGYDSREFTIVSTSLFHQRLAPQGAEADWKGDWLFRRSRLELLDLELLNSRPDLLLFQQMLTRRGSPSESDKNILSAGSLDGYQWTSTKVTSYEDTQEEQFLAIASSLPIRISANQPSDNLRELAVDGFVTANVVSLNAQPILVVNLEMPSSVTSAEAWFQVVGDFIAKKLEQTNICSERLIVGGYIPIRQNSLPFGEFIQRFNLKDSSEGHCELVNTCLTLSPDNDLAKVTNPGDSGSQTERILIPRDAIVSESKMIFNNALRETKDFESFGIDRVWATVKYGWKATVTIQGCSGN